MNMVNFWRKPEKLKINFIYGSFRKVSFNISIK